MKYSKILFTSVITFLLHGCGGRVAEPVTEHSALDSRLSCSHIKGEQEVHIARINELIGEKSQKAGANVGLVVLLGPAAIPFIDINGAEKLELESIDKRLKVLKTLADEKGCPSIESIDEPESLS